MITYRNFVFSILLCFFFCVVNKCQNDVIEGSSTYEFRGTELRDYTLVRPYQGIPIFFIFRNFF